MLTARKVYEEIVDMPISERERLFSIIARLGFEKEHYMFRSNARSNYA